MLFRSLERTATYANPADGKFIPLHGESKMYPNEAGKIDLEDLQCATPRDTDNPFKVTSLETVFDSSEKSMTLSFSTQAITSRGNEGVPHANGGFYLDICGTFKLTASVDGKDVDLGKDVTVEIKPYESFHTMWEIYDELDKLATMGDNNPDTAKPYVEKKVMGQSAAGYDMPYLIVAKDSDAVNNWLELCDRAETDPEGVLADIKADKLTYQVPVLYSNIHSNEVAAVDGIMAFAQMLVEEDSISYEKLLKIGRAHV